MPTTKLGSSSLTDISKTRNEHFDLDTKAMEFFQVMPLDVKRKLVSRLPAIIDEIKADIQNSEMEV